MWGNSAMLRKIFNNNRDATSGVGTAHTSGAPDFTPIFSGVRVTRSLDWCVCFVDRFPFVKYTVVLIYFEFLSNTVSQAAIVSQQPSEHSTGQEFSHLTVETRWVSVKHCFACSDCLTTTVRALDGTIILTFNSMIPLGQCKIVYVNKYINGNIFLSA